MKNLFFIGCICVVNAISAAAQEGWSVGVEAMPNLFWLYNQSDWNEQTYGKGKDPSFFPPNGIQAGIGAKYALNENMELGASLLYSYGIQKYDYPTYDQSVVKRDNYVELKHLKLPISITYLFGDTDNGRNLFLETGVIPTYLLEGVEHIASFDVKDDGHYIYEHRNNIRTAWEKEIGQDETTYSKTMEKQPYNKFGLAMLLGAGVKINLTDNLNLRLKMQSTLELTNPENKDWELLAASRYGNGDAADRKPTHHINVGLFISTYYIFD